MTRGDKVALALGGAAALGLTWLLTRSKSPVRTLEDDLAMPDATTPEDRDTTAILATDLLISTQFPSSVARWIPVAAHVALDATLRPADVSERDWAILLLAVIEQESRGDTDAVGDGGKAWGLMQINEVGKPAFAALTRAQKTDPETNVRWGASVLRAGRAMLVGVPAELLTRWMVATYNRGPKPMVDAARRREWTYDVDQGTWDRRYNIGPGYGYSANVLARIEKATRGVA